MLCRSMLLLAGAAWLSIFAIEARGQADREPRVYFPKKTQPAEPLRYDNGADMRLIVVVKGAAILDRPASQGVPKIIAQPPYFAPLVAYTQTSDLQYFLVKNPRTEKWGWIDRTFVLDAYEPLRSDNPAEPVFLKVLFKHPWHVPVADRAQTVSFFNGPGPQYDIVERGASCRICYAYAIRQAADGRSYILVGKAPAVYPETPENTFIGWLSQASVMLWDSRVGVYYNQQNLWERHEPVNFFHSDAALQGYIHSGHDHHAIAREDWTTNGTLSYDAMRFPVLAHTPDGNLKVAFAHAVEATPYLQQLMREQGMDLGTNPLPEPHQRYVAGWVASQSPHGYTQLEFWLLMERSTLDELVGIVASLEALTRRSAEAGLSHALKAALARTAGTAIQDREYIADFLQRRYQIPTRDRVTVLRYTPEQLEERFRDSRLFKQKFLRNLGYKYALLQSVIEEHAAKLEWDAAGQRWRKVRPVAKRWWWTTESDTEFAWIPFDYLP